MFFTNLVDKYKSRYTIPYLDLADAGESNRILVQLASIGLFGFSIFCLVFFAIYYRTDLLHHKRTFFYYSIFLIFSIYGFLASKPGKEVERSKAYIKKTIPFYVLMYVIFADAVFTVILFSNAFPFRISNFTWIYDTIFVKGVWSFRICKLAYYSNSDVLPFAL